MPILHKISANGSLFSARSGAVLLDAALLQGVEFPHDCRAGRCGTCLTRVKKGITLGGETGEPRTVYACQARVLSDLKVEFDDLPPPQTVGAQVTGMTDLAQDVVELQVRPDGPLPILPGQYCRFTFRGFPTRAYSPTVSMTGETQAESFRLQIQRVPGGQVSTNLGERICSGHRLTIEGPFGTAFHRPGRSERLVLVARGTGFAPILAVADAALRENFQRDMVVIAASRRIEELYMPAALGRLSTAPNASVVATVEQPQGQSRLVRTGPVEDHLPCLTRGDIVYVAGGRRFVEGVANLARAVGAQVHFDAFESSGSDNSAGGFFGKFAKTAKSVVFGAAPAAANGNSVGRPTINVPPRSQDRRWDRGGSAPDAA